MNVFDQRFAPPPHLLNNRLSPTRVGSSSSPTMATRKRKADDDGSFGDDDRMSASPSASPAVQSRPLPRNATKRLRTNLTGRPLSRHRLLETLGADELRNLLDSICDRHPEINNLVMSTAPRPSVQSTLDTLKKYENAFQAAFPLGRSTSDYAYNRVKHQLHELLEALKDFTPCFLPPNEPQPATSLAFLDGATDFIHRLPEWESYQHNRRKEDAYEEMAKAWTVVIREAAKKAGGIQLQYGGWDQKIAKHNEMSGGRMQEAMLTVRESLGWIGGEAQPQAGGGQGHSMSIREQLLNGTYGAGTSVSVGPW
ncbi:tethering factor for nuclear proteasome sts1 [Sporormia fimetaria CBS 119925]|uniref:Tethering factor for nuclear proteasome STS1 n=1 Tax=Sporormia fimetaria CBS 119925 TaxID=1340428 RepID=A0A6A6UWC4_9PLEO|nr:tethering factor for nuclear proteasome sts1 [Sporormia fimetaria CBS 119925]